MGPLESRFKAKFGERFLFVVAMVGNVAVHRIGAIPMMRIASIWHFVLVSLLVASGAMAADVRVGRITVQTDAGWRAYALDDLGVNYGGDLSGTIPSETKAFVHESADMQLNAVVIVRASAGGLGRGRMAYSPVCKGTADMLAVGNSGFNRTYAECWSVSPKQDAQTILNSRAPRALSGLGSLQMPQTLVLITSRYANDSGNFLEVTLLLAPTFLGREGQFNTTLPEGVESRFALVGQDFAKAVRDCMNSFSGKFSFPPMAFSK